MDVVLKDYLKTQNHQLNSEKTAISSPITVMQRYELKYILNKDQLTYLKTAIASHMKLDEYGRTSIMSIYYDTPDYRLVRASIEKPEFKEKLRLRSYGLANKDSKVFLELKRKVAGIVYKRRLALTEDAANEFFSNHYDIDSQIGLEISYFKKYYQELNPAFLIIYDREAYKEIDGDLRLTIDENPRYRTNNLNLHTSLDGESLLPEGYAILEIKIQQAFPLWLSEILAKGKIYKSSFSKVGEAYKKEMLKHSMERRS